MNIQALTLLSSNIEETGNFYSQKLELPIINRSKTEISITAGSSRLTFKETKQANPIYHFAFNIPHNKLEEALNWLKPKAKIINISEDKQIIDFESWNAKSFYFRDNNNNILEFIARFDLKNETNKNFNGSSILSISEIGIATDNVPAECEKLKTSYQLKEFEKQKPTDQFAAFGDNEGLIVLSAATRNWFPTNNNAEKNYTEIQLSDKGEVKKLSYHL